jgi:type IV pilus assembly protein PilC
MAMMMTAGLSASQSVEVTARTIENYYMSKNMGSIVPDLEAGRPIAQTLAKTEVFPRLVTEMTGVGEETGDLEHTLDVVSQYYDFEVQEATARAISALEPVTIIFLAGIAGLVVTAVYLPMFTMFEGT